MTEKTPDLIDPFAGPDDDDPDLNPDPSADAPPFGDEPEDDDDDAPVEGQDIR